MTERPSDDGLRDILSDDDAWVTRGEIQEMARELVELRTTQEHLRARCVWLQERRKALQRSAATRMVRLRTLRKLRARLAAGPVMPEVPGDAVIDAACGAGWGDHWIGPDRYLAVYAAIRAALLKEPL